MREHWTLDPGVIHLNHGSFGAVPAAAQRLQDRLRDECESDPTRWFREMPPRLARTREEIGWWLGVDGGDIALLPNATTGVNAALRSIPVAAGQRIVLTDHGYGAVWLAAKHVADRAGADVVVVPVPLDADDDAVLALLDPYADGQTAALVVDQVTSPTAKVLPTARIAELGRSRSVPVVVDGAHAPGLLDNPVTGDFWTGNLHKWPCAPRGTGVLYVAPEYRAGFTPPTVSWDEPRGFPRSMDYPGTTDVTGWLAAPSALDLLDDLGFAERRKDLGELVESGAEDLAAAWGGSVVDVGTPAPTMRLVSLPDGLLAEPMDGNRMIAVIAEETDVETSCVYWSGRGYLRLSAHLYNTPDDFAVAAERLGALFADRGRVAALLGALR